MRRLAGTYIETAKLILQKLPEAQFLVPLASRETRTIFENEIWKQEAQHLPITLLFGHAHDAMIAADGVLVASGTATLEAALLKCPMVITYKMSPLSYWIAKRKQYLPYIGLPNILAGKFVVPEILQDDATPENLAQALLNLVNNKHAVAELEQTFSNITSDLAPEHRAESGCGHPALSGMSGIILICGVDEAGRGPLAGPVSAAAVILDVSRPIEGLADSKKLSEKQRDRLAPIIRESALAWAVAYAEVGEIDAAQHPAGDPAGDETRRTGAAHPAAASAGGRPVLPANRHSQPGHRQG